MFGYYYKVQTTIATIISETIVSYVLIILMFA